MADPADVPLHELVQLPFDDYIKAPGANASGLKTILRSPLHFITERLEPRKPTPALDFGHLLHMAVLEPELYFRKRKLKPKFDRRTNKGKADDAAWIAALGPDDVEVPEAWDEQIARMCGKVQEHPIARRILEKGTREGTFWWNDPRTGLLCKARPDFVSAQEVILDIKTTGDARNDPFSRSMWEYRYDIQAAHYTAGGAEAGLSRPDAYAFLVMEKDPPYEVAIYTAGASVLGIGSQWRDKAMDIYARCMRTGEWPGYEAKARVIELPPWAKGVEDDEDK